MNKIKKKRTYFSMGKLYPIMIFIATIFMGIGYASINSILLNIDGEVVAKAQEDIFITNVEYVEREDALEGEGANINLANGTMLNSTIILEPNDVLSEVSLKVSFYNSTNYDYIFKDVIYDESLISEMPEIYSNTDIIYTFNNQDAMILANQTLEVIITFKYSSTNYVIPNVLTSILNFEFDLPVHIVGEYDYTGNYETFIVPHDGIYKIELWGAQGGSYNNEYIGGYGGYTSGEIYLAKADELYVYVGQMPLDWNGGYNGGGNGTHDFVNGNITRNFAGGGGATDVRLIKGNWDDFESLKSRIIVAGAGSAGYYWETTSTTATNWSLKGQSAGGLIGNYYSDVIKTCISTGGSQTSGGVCDSYTSVYGGFGYGGEGVGGSTDDKEANAASGGGSGYYGGAGRYDSPSSSSVGGGGSSFISGHNGCDAIFEESTKTNIIHSGQCNHYSGYIFSNTAMIDGNGYLWTTEIGDYVGMPSHDGTSIMTGNTGNGYAKITYIRKK